MAFYPEINDLIWQPVLSACTEIKGLFRALANPRCVRDGDRAIRTKRDPAKFTQEPAGRTLRGLGTDAAEVVPAIQRLQARLVGWRGACAGSQRWRTLDKIRRLRHICGGDTSPRTTDHPDATPNGSLSSNTMGFERCATSSGAVAA